MVNEYFRLDGLYGGGVLKIKLQLIGMNIGAFIYNKSSNQILLYCQFKILLFPPI